MIILCLSDSYFSFFFRSSPWLIVDCEPRLHLVNAAPLQRVRLRHWSRCGMVFVCVFYTQACSLVQVFFDGFFVFKSVFVVFRLRRQLAAVHRIYVLIFHLCTIQSHTCPSVSLTLSLLLSIFYFHFPIAFEQILFLDIREINMHGISFGLSCDTTGAMGETENHSISLGFRQ